MVKALLVGLFCSQLLLASQPPDRIFGGEVIQPEDPLYQSAPVIMNGSHLRCSSAIIDDEIILTAAHCTPGAPFSLHFSGSIDGDGPTKLVWKIETHPDYNQFTLHADLAVARIEGGIPPGYRKMKIAELDLGQPGEIATLIGFGISVAAEATTGHGILRKTTVGISEVGSDLITFNQFDGKGACYGDSGGPAVMERNGTWEIVGIASYVDPSDCSFHSYYTRPSFYSNWLKEAIKRLKQDD